MKKHFYHSTVVFLLFVVVSCVKDNLDIKDRSSYNLENVWEYSGDIAVLNKVIKELKNGPNKKNLENTFLKNDVLWEESKFLFIDNKKRILVPFLSEDRSTVQGVLSLAKDAKGKTSFTITDRYQSMRENSSLPFWDGGTWLGYFLALDKDILGTKNGSPGIATRPVKNKPESSLTMRMECSTQQTGEIVFYKYTYVLSGGEVSNFYFEITHTEPIYSTVCYDVPDPVIPPSGGGSGGGSSSPTTPPPNPTTSQIGKDYVPKSTDKLVKAGIVTTCEKQSTVGVCVLTSLEVTLKNVLGLTVTSKEINTAAALSAGSLLVIQDGLTPAQAVIFINSFCNTEALTKSDFKTTIDAGKTFMTDIKTGTIITPDSAFPTDRSKDKTVILSHSVSVIGYDVAGNYIYIDPALGKAQIAPLADMGFSYSIIIKGKK